MSSSKRERTLKVYGALVATKPDFKIKGKASAYTSLNGHMFSFVTKEGDLAIRLGKAAQAAFMEKHGTGPVIQYGSTMRGYVEVPPRMLKDMDGLSDLFQESIDYIRSLEPKPTTRKKSAAKSGSKAKAKAKTGGKAKTKSAKKVKAKSKAKPRSSATKK